MTLLFQPCDFLSILRMPAAKSNAICVKPPMWEQSLFTRHIRERKELYCVATPQENPCAAKIPRMRRFGEYNYAFSPSDTHTAGTSVAVPSACLGVRFWVHLFSATLQECHRHLHRQGR